MSTKNDILKGLRETSNYIKVVNTETGKLSWKSLQELDFEKETPVYTKSGRVCQAAVLPGRRPMNENISSQEEAEVPAPLMEDVSEEERELAESYLQRRRRIRNSGLVRSVKTDPENVDVLQKVMVDMAEEIESLKYSRMLAEKNGEPIDRFSKNILGGQRSLVETYFKAKLQASDKELDLSSHAFQNLLTFIVETFKESMHSSEIRPNEIKQVLIKLGEALGSETWVLKAKKRMRSGDE